MLEATVNRQLTSVIPTESRPILDHQDIESVSHPIHIQSPITKINPAIFNNSMFHSDMGFFVPPAEVLTNVSKRKQFPAPV